MADPYFSNVSILLHCEQAYDAAKQASFNYIGTPTFSTAQKKFGDKSLALNGSNQYLYFNASSDYVLGTGQFTIELWVYFSSVTSAQRFITNQYGQPNSWGFYYSGSGTSNLSFEVFGVSTASGSFTPATNTWYAVAVDRDSSNKLRLYVDGVMVGSATSFTANASYSGYLTVGAGVGAGYVNGYLDEIRLTKGVARYASDSGYTVSTTYFSPADPTYITVSEGLNTSGTLTSNLLGSASTSDSMTVNDASFKFGYVAAVTNGSTLTDTSSQVVKPGGIIDEVIQTQETFGLNFKYAVTQVERPQIRDALLLTFPRVITDGVVASDLATATRALLVLEGLRLTDPAVARGTYLGVFAEALRIEDTFRNFFGGDVSDSFTVADSILKTYHPTKTVSDQVNVADVLGQSLILRVTAADTINIDDINVLKMLFRPTLLDGVDISAAYIAPNGSITTWAINTENAAVTEYSNYAFNSFAQMGYKYLGASSSGLYELNGDDDHGTDIVSVIKTGLAQFGGSRFSMFKAAYLGVRGGGDYVLRLETGDGKFYDYDVVAQDMQTTKIRLGKGLRARYFSFQLTSTGQDFDLDSIEFVPLVAQRRV